MINSKLFFNNKTKIKMEKETIYTEAINELKQVNSVYEWNLVMDYYSTRLSQVQSATINMSGLIVDVLGKDELDNI